MLEYELDLTKDDQVPENSQAILTKERVEGLRGRFNVVTNANGFKKGFINVQAGVFDDPFIFPRFFRRNVVGIVTQHPALRAPAAGAPRPDPPLGDYARRQWRPNRPRWAFLAHPTSAFRLSQHPSSIRAREGHHAGPRPTDHHGGCAGHLPLPSRGSPPLRLEPGCHDIRPANQHGFQTVVHCPTTWRKPWRKRARHCCSSYPTLSPGSSRVQPKMIKSSLQTFPISHHAGRHRRWRLTLSPAQAWKASLFLGLRRARLLRPRISRTLPGGRCGFLRLGRLSS